MGLLFNLAQNYVNQRYPGWHTEMATRYYPVVKDVKKYGLMDSAILEVGSGTEGITPYLRRKVVGVDVDFTRSKRISVRPVKATVTKLPFQDKSFDVVLTVDMLEHLPQEIREEAIKDMMRVAKKRLYISTPCGEDSESHDAEFDQVYRQANNNRPYHFITEHIEHGLPDQKQIEEMLDSISKVRGMNIKIKVIKNSNIKVRRLYMHAWAKHNYRLTLACKVMMPIIKRINFGKCYRAMFAIEVK